MHLLSSVHALWHAFSFSCLIIFSQYIWEITILWSLVKIDLEKAYTYVMELEGTCCDDLLYRLMSCMPTIMICYASCFSICFEYTCSWWHRMFEIAMHVTAYIWRIHVMTFEVLLLDFIIMFHISIFLHFMYYSWMRTKWFYIMLCLHNILLHVIYG